MGFPNPMREELAVERADDASVATSGLFVLASIRAHSVYPSSILSFGKHLES